MAVEYASPYKGTASGYIYTSAHARSTASSAGMAQAPVASMNSVSRVPSYGAMPSAKAMPIVATTAMPVQGIYTAASSIRGGITTTDTGGHPHIGRHIKKEGTPDPGGEFSDCGCVDANKDGFCDICNHPMPEDEFDECQCITEDGYCWCPLDLNWGAILFLSILAIAYGLYKKRTRTVLARP